ncbi:MAG: hypothetical protein K2Q20_05905, partial [Phycisphaerales bacterium]|nr:hypothetical protein [Phycisphaerales bacterium]
TQNVVTYTVEIVTENPDLKLLPYLTANVRFELARADKTLTVPNAALRWEPPSAAAAAAPRAAGAGAGGRPSAPAKAETPGVWVLRDSGPARVEVTPGVSDGTQTAVQSADLKEGDTVIVGEATSTSQRAGGGSPFAPPMMGGRGGGGGGGGGGRPR